MMTAHSRAVQAAIVLSMQVLSVTAVAQEASGDRSNPLKIKAEAANAPYIQTINGYAAAFGVDPALVMAVITVESGGNPNASSYAGAMGLMQLMPAVCLDYGVVNPYNPDENIRGGTALLGRHLKRYNGDLEKVLAAYNAGPRRADNGSWKRIGETRRYVPLVLSYYQALRPDGNGTAPIDIPNAPIVKIPPPPAFPALRYLDVMFDAVSIYQSTNHPSTIAENGKLHEVAGTVLTDYQDGKVSLAGIPNGILRELKKNKLSFKGLKTYAFQTEDVASFADAWSDLNPIPGTYAGLAHGNKASGHVWIVIVASD